MKTWTPIRPARLARILARSLCLAAALLLPAAPQAAEKPPVIAAASSLRLVLPQIAAAFEQETGSRLRIVYGSSGNLARQIANGAPFELFLAADEAYARKPVDLGIARGGSEIYALGRICFLVPKTSPLHPDPTLSDLRAALHDGRLNHFAIANPEHAPYGKRAREVLEKATLWNDIEAKLIYGENVSQAARFAAFGNTDGGLVACSMTLPPEISRRGLSTEIGADRHAPLEQHMVLMDGAGDTVTRLFEFLKSTTARALFRAHGFDVPEPPGARATDG